MKAIVSLVCVGCIAIVTFTLASVDSSDGQLHAFATVSSAEANSVSGGADEVFCGQMTEYDDYCTGGAWCWVFGEYVPVWYFCHEESTHGVGGDGFFSETNINPCHSFCGGDCQGHTYVGEDCDAQ